MPTFDINLDYSRAEVAADARHRHMKLWYFTAIVPRDKADAVRSVRPLGGKNIDYDKIKSNENKPICVLT